MAEQIQACCEKARQQYERRLIKGVASYPVIKDVPCPTCRRIIPIRIYARPAAASENAQR